VKRFNSGYEETMKKNGVWSIASLIILVAIVARGPDIFAAQKGDGSSFERFLAHPSKQFWDSLDADVRKSTSQIYRE
jgi:hypothetical protein